MRKQKVLSALLALFMLIIGGTVFAQQNTIAPPQWIRGEWQHSENGQLFSLGMKADDIIWDGGSLRDLTRNGEISLTQRETTTGYQLYFKFKSDGYWYREFFIKPKGGETSMKSNFTDSKGADREYTYTKKAAVAVDPRPRPVTPQAPAAPVAPAVQKPVQPAPQPKPAPVVTPAVPPAPVVIPAVPPIPAPVVVPVVPPAPKPAAPVAKPAPAVPAAPRPAVQPKPAPVAKPAAPPAAAKPAPVVTPVAPPASSSKETATRGKITAVARKYLGARYIYGAQSPPRAFDCSGFVGQAYKEGANVILPRTSKVLAKTGNGVNRNNIKPGDIIYFDIQGYGVISHVALVLDSKSMIHAVSEGRGMAITALNDKWYAPKIAGYRSVFANGEISLSGGIRDGVAVGARTTDRPLSEIFLELSGRPEKSTDDIRMAMDTGLHFTLLNKTGGDADFDVYFYQKGTSRDRGDHEKISVQANTAKELVNAFFAEKSGQYMVEIHKAGAGGAALIEKTWIVE